MAMHVNDVVQISGSAPLSESPELLGQELGELVTSDVTDDAHLAILSRGIAIGVKHRACYRGRYEELISRQVEPDLGWGRRPHRPEKHDTPLCGRVSAPVLSTPEGSVLNDQFQAALLTCPVTNLGEDASKYFWFISTTNDCEIEVLREAVGLKEALAKAGTTLEDPACEFGVCSDTRQKPAEYIVLFNDVMWKQPLGVELPNLAIRDHDASTLSTLVLTSNPQRVERRPEAGRLGSSKTNPDVRRMRQASTMSP